MCGEEFVREEVKRGGGRVRGSDGNLECDFECDSERDSGRARLCCFVKI